MLLTDEQINALKKALQTEKFTATAEYYSSVSGFMAGMRTAFILTLSTMHDQLKAHSRSGEDRENIALKLSIRDVINLYNTFEHLKHDNAEIAFLFEKRED